MSRDGETSLGAVIGLLDGIADPVKLGLVRVLVELDAATIAELRDACQASVPTLRRHLEAMTARGIVAEEAGASDGLTPGRPATRFSLSAGSREEVRRLLGLSRTVRRESSLR